MATVHFTGTHYAGLDGPTSLNLSQPGYYDVSDAKAAQLTADFPHEFTLVPEGELVTPPAADTAESEPAATAESEDKTGKKGK